jgi:hypothetical protein
MDDVEDDDDRRSFDKYDNNFYIKESQDKGLGDLDTGSQSYLSEMFV